MTLSHSATLSGPRHIFRRRSRWAMFSRRAAVLVLAVVAVA
ncbi:MAG: hypothetical protein OER92_08110 [Alphaproteobacteria bacterium]|nr:hypothetical protein [Alphaproteobacteria bacterium]